MPSKGDKKRAQNRAIQQRRRDRAEDGRGMFPVRRSAIPWNR